MNATTEAYTFLESKREGLYRELTTEALARSGIAHAAHDCLLLGAPLPSSPHTIEILYAHGNMTALFRLARLLSTTYTHLTWQRQFKGKDTYFTTSFNKLLKHQNI